MALVTCGLTAKDWDQLRNPTHVSSTLPYLTAGSGFAGWDFCCS